MDSTFLHDLYLGLWEDAERAYHSSRRMLVASLIFWGFFGSLLFWAEGVLGESRWEVPVIGAVFSFVIVVVPQIFAVVSVRSRLKDLDAIIQQFEEVKG